MTKKSFIKLLILTILLLFLYSLTLKRSSRDLIEYYYHEGFEKTEANPLQSWVNNLDKKSSVDVVYRFDSQSSTQGESALTIDVNVTTQSPKKWYYYLQIPLSPTLNLKDKVSFALDVKMNQEASQNVQIGFNLNYFPYSSGILPIQQTIESDKWTTLKIDDLEKFTLTHANGFISNIYDAHLEDFGRAVSKIVILIKGRGSKKYHIGLDNLKIEGKIEKEKLFVKGYQDAWHQYTKRVQRKIQEKKELYHSLAKNQKESSSITFYSNKIETIFNEINSSFKKGKLLKTSMIKELDDYLRKLQYLKSKGLSSLNIYKMPPMNYYRFTSTNVPKLEGLKSYYLRMVAGEYHSIAMLMESSYLSQILSISNGDFLGDNSKFSKDNLDVYVAKVWYQSGLENTLKTGKYLTQELLLKDDGLVKVDYKKKSNYLRVKYKKNNKKAYIKISNPQDKFPDTNSIVFNDSKQLKPFKLDSLRAKIVWGIVHVPKKTEAGNYKSIIKIVDNKSKKVLKEIPITIEVLPFTLDRPKQVYSLYYTGKLRDKKVDPIDSYNKTKKQQRLELKDIKEHGVLYPTSYEALNNLEETLQIREELGFPTDRFYTIGFNVMNSNLSNKIESYQKILKKYNYKKLYVYGVDEASQEVLEKEKKLIDRVHQLKAKVFVAGYNYTYDSLGDRVDVFNYANAIFKQDIDSEIEKWHKINREIFAYASPQAGVENPEVYRRNFGCKLWKHEFDGAMNWAYQAHRGAFWNDFDTGNSRLTNYREEVFTYPTTDGIVGTVQWEGFRQAIIDVQYLSTLENLRDKLKREGQNVSELNQFLQEINCNADLEKLREEIINKILKNRSLVHAKGKQ